MAGDWIKMRTDLAEDPAVIAIAEAVGLREEFVVGLLWKLWSWADQQTTDGNAAGVTEKWVDRYLSVPGFGAAMAVAAWLRFENGRMVFPNFDRHNGKTGKVRALTAKRVSAHKAAKSNGASVTRPLPREEKRREDKESASADSPEAAEPPSGPPAAPLLRFPTRGKTREWLLYPSEVAELGAAFPDLDVLAECRKSLAWVHANPLKTKTARGMSRFLFGWMERAQNNGGKRGLFDASDRGPRNSMGPNPSRLQPPPGKYDGRERVVGGGADDFAPPARAAPPVADPQAPRAGPDPRADAPGDP